MKVSEACDKPQQRRVFEANATTLLPPANIIAAAGDPELQQPIFPLLQSYSHQDLYSSEEQI